MWSKFVLSLKKNNNKKTLTFASWRLNQGLPQAHESINFWAMIWVPKEIILLKYFKTFFRISIFVCNTLNLYKRLKLFLSEICFLIVKLMRKCFVHHSALFQCVCVCYVPVCMCLCKTHKCAGVCARICVYVWQSTWVWGI